MDTENRKKQRKTSEFVSGKEEKKHYWNVRPYLPAGLVAFVVAVLIIVVFFLFYRYEGFAKGWNKLMFVFQPILIGLAIAYLINPIVRRVECVLKKKYLAKGKDEVLTLKRIRCISVAVAMLVFFCILAVLILLIVPQVVESVQGLIQNLPSQIESLNEWVKDLTSQQGQYAESIQEAASKIEEWLGNWVEQELLPQSQKILASVTTGVITAVKTCINFLIGIVIAIYVLTTKETLTAQCKKLIYTIMKPERGNWVIKVIRKSDTIFGSFIIGKIIDSIIIGIICFVALSIMQMPYTILVSVIVGVTNVIPFFGPFIGAIPSVLLILLVNPWQALYFLIFVFILQQVDGNIIGPLILGDKTGLSTFWVLCAILVFGGIFGIPGMILGVPAFGVIYYIVQEIMEIVLKKRKLPYEQREYHDLNSVDAETNKMVYWEKEEEK